MRSITLVLSAVLAGAALSGCGSSAPASTSSSSSGSPGAAPGVAVTADSGRALQFARCMRSHGVTNFPDPSSGGTLQLQIQRTPDSTSVNGVEVNGPAFQAAMSACRADLPNGGHAPTLTAARRQAVLRFAQCMRGHGVTGFPDPQFRGGGVAFQFHPGSGMDPNAPTFRAAQRACSGILGKGGPGGGPKGR